MDIYGKTNWKVDEMFPENVEQLNNLKTKEWNWISYKQELDEDFIILFRDKLNWEILCHKYNFSEDFLILNYKYINLDIILYKNKNLSQTCLELIKNFEIKKSK